MNKADTDGISSDIPAAQEKQDTLSNSEDSTGSSGLASLAEDSSPLLDDSKDKATDSPASASRSDTLIAQEKPLSETDSEV